MMMDRSHHTWPGVYVALASAVLFGLSTPIAKLLLGSAPPLTLAGLLYAGSGGGLYMTRLLTCGRTRVGAPLQKTDLPWLLLIIAAGGIAGPLLLLIGLASTPAASASLLLNLESVFTLVIAWLIFRENVDMRVGLGAAAIVAAAVLLSWSGGPAGATWKSLAIVGACLAWAVDNNVTRKISTSDPIQLAMIKGLAAGTVNLAAAGVLGSAWPRARMIADAAALGFVSYGLSLVCFIVALRHLGAARTGAYFSFAPFVGAAVSIGFLGEPLSTAFIASAGLMAVGLYLHVTERHQHTHVHEPMSHTHRHVHDAHHQHLHGPDDPPEEPHTHAHQHEQLVHSHPHYPDAHHRHRH
jgi:drug/metabolite transporter (DMT)-like permease